LKRLDTGALVKDYEGPEKEMTVAYQMAVSDVTFEDERYVVCHSPQTQLELS
jgi:5'-3' exoribonuclease 1